MLRVLAILLSLLSLHSVSFAENPPTHEGKPAEAPRFSSPKDVDLKEAPTVVLVTHATKDYDSKGETQYYLGKLLEQAKAKGLPILFLARKDELDVLCDRRLPDHWLESRGGELPQGLVLKPKRVISVGGNFTYCQHGTITAVIASWAKRGESGEIYLFFPALFDGRGNRIWPETIKRSSLKKRDEGKLSEVGSISKIFDLFESDEARFEHLKFRSLEYIKEVLLGYLSSDDRGAIRRLSDYNITVNYRNRNDTIQEGSGKDTPTLQFHFIHPSGSDEKSIQDALDGLFKQSIRKTP